MSRVKRNQTLLRSFKVAIQGIADTTQKERNMRIHGLCAGAVMIAGIFFELHYVEWALCIFAIGLVISMELVNTAIEATVDLMTESYHPLAKCAKDAAAGAVLVSSIAAACIGLVIFLPKLLAMAL